MKTDRELFNLLCPICSEKMMTGFCDDCGVCCNFTQEKNEKKSWCFQKTWHQGPFFDREEFIRIFKLQSFQ